MPEQYRMSSKKSYDFVDKHVNEWLLDKSQTSARGLDRGISLRERQMQWCPNLDVEKMPISYLTVQVGVSRYRKNRKPTSELLPLFRTETFPYGHRCFTISNQACFWVSSLQNRSLLKVAVFMVFFLSAPNPREQTVLFSVNKPKRLLEDSLPNGFVSRGDWSRL